MKSYNALVAFVASLAICTAAHATYLGNPLVNNGSTDGDAALVILGEYNATAPGASSTLAFTTPGTIHSVEVWDNSVNSFTAYLYQPAGTSVDGFQQFKIVDGQSFTTTNPGGVGGIETFPLTSGWSVQPGDLIGFWGKGPSYANGTGVDGVYQNDGQYTASQPVIGNTYTFGAVAPGSGPVADYNYLTGGNVPRVYAFGVNYTPEPSSFILCGLGAVGLFIAVRRRRKA